ncbi:MAG: trypsin-like protein serine protease, partial [uncultured bacterium]
TNFNATGQFNRPFLGIEYRMITRQLAILNEVPEGAYVMDIVEGSAAEKGGLKEEDIITKIDGDKITETNDLAKTISSKKVGDTIELSIWRDGKELTLKITLGMQE